MARIYSPQRNRPSLILAKHFKGLSTASWREIDFRWSENFQTIENVTLEAEELWAPSRCGGIDLKV